MSSDEGIFSIRPPIFNGTNFFFFKVGIKAYLQALGDDVWEIVESGYEFLAFVPLDIA